MGTVLPTAPAVLIQTLPKIKIERDAAKIAPPGMGPMGNYPEVEKLNQRVYVERKRLLGQEHPYTLSSMATLVSTYWNQGGGYRETHINNSIPSISRLGPDQSSLVSYMSLPRGYFQFRYYLDRGSRVEFALVNRYWLARTLRSSLLDI
jgi:hypothetical protein